MGFFIGWKYFDSNDYYSFEAQRERNRLRQEKADKERRAAKKAERKRQQQKEKKRKQKEEWVAEAAEYHKEQFNLDGYSYESSYINANVEEYKNATEKKYSGQYHSTDEKNAPSLNRGLGSGPTMSIKGANGNRGDDLHKMGSLKKKRPPGMAPIGMETNKSVSGTGANTGDSGGGQQSNAAPSASVKLNRPF